MPSGGVTRSFHLGQSFLQELWFQPGDSRLGSGSVYHLSVVLDHSLMAALLFPVILPFHLLLQQGKISKNESSLLAYPSIYEMLLITTVFKWFCVVSTRL